MKLEGKESFEFVLVIVQMLEEVEDSGFEYFVSGMEYKADRLLFHESPQPFNDVEVRRVSEQEPLSDQRLPHEPILEKLARVVADVVTNENKPFSWILLPEFLMEGDCVLGIDPFCFHYHCFTRI